MKAGIFELALITGSLLSLSNILIAKDHIRINKAIPGRELKMVDAENEVSDHVIVHRAKHSVATISPQCLSAQQNSLKMQTLCHGAEKCQATREKRPQMEAQLTQSQELIRKSSVGGDDNNVTGGSCKTLWVSCISLEFPDEKNDLSGDGYKQEYTAALHSAMQNAKDSLQPVLVIFNGSRQNKQNATYDQLPEFGVWAQSMGVKVIQVFDLSFQETVYDSFPEYRTNGLIACYTRLEMPRFINEYQLFDEPGICRRHLLYTDNDVLFLNPLTRQDLSRLKERMGETILMYGQDFLINRRKPSNTGVMLMDVEGFAKEWPTILEWGKKQKEFPKHDQLWLNRYYADPKKWKAQNSLLPTYYNWKVYWQLEPNLLSDVQIVHFHGPKPGSGVETIAECDFDAYDRISNPHYKSFMQHAICCDSGKTANSIVGLYEEFKKMPSFGTVQ